MTGALVFVAIPPSPPVPPVLPGALPLAPFLKTLHAAGIEDILLLATRNVLAGIHRDEPAGFTPVEIDETSDDNLLYLAKQGLAHLDQRCERLLLFPISPSCPSPPSKEVMQALFSAPSDLLVPLYGQVPGFPLLLSNRLFSNIQKNKVPGRGIAPLIQAAGTTPHFLPFSPDDDFVSAESDEAEPSACTGYPPLFTVRPTMKLALRHEEAFFGPGPYRLLRLIEQTGSLRMACTQMGLSYSKGWKTVENIEKQFGYKVLFRTRGGQEHGRSELTKNGRWLLEKYAAYQNDLSIEMYRLYLKHFL
ncbi:LysR family transcriptional regulator [Ruminococcaceae bacterium OttesenSCG-928-I18]|nr:LysR family transcriptional regulator [Ruminococcaceae bacterium OttesenSCG-928-I18]